jgi:dTDP-4-dehydrorhamnose 3,5-epimerase
MKFTETPLAGAYVVEVERREDDRGFFGRTFCEREFAALGLISRFVQCNVSYNRRRGTVRGMHYQADPYPEIKLVRCTTGAIVDAIVDLRPESPTHRRWFSVELSAENHRALYIPAGMAHGFQTLADDVEVLYMMSEYYHGDLARGVRWNDPAFDLAWPEPITVIADKDLAFPDYKP